MKKLTAIVCALLLGALATYAQPQAGDKAPAFALENTQEKTVTLKSLEGKWVVLDFWGSWCRWCIKGFPEMKAAYAEHKGKVEFVGLDWGDSRENWLKAVKAYELPWLNLRLDPDNGGKELLEAYGIQGFPTKIVIDPKGVIRNVTVGEDPAFYPTLTSLLSNSRK